MPDTWKAHELAIAKRLGSKRTGPTGKTGSDVAHSLFAVECKERRRPLCKDIRDAIDQSVGAAREGQLPIVVWHVVGDRHDKDVVFMRLADFEQWAGTLEVPE